MNRRQFVAGAVGVLAHARTANAQSARRLPRVGFLNAASYAASTTRLEAFGKALREFGYTEGQNIAIDFRFADGKLERLPALAAELLRLKVDVIVAGGLPAARAAKQVTTTIPIVLQGGDPVATGLVASLARPGGNVTGLSDAADVTTKRLQILTEVVPGLTRVALMLNTANATKSLVVRRADEMGRSLGVTVRPVDVKRPDDFERAFAAIARDRAGALLVPGDALFASHRKRLVQLAAKRRLPAMYATAEYAEVGGLMSYGTHLPDLYRRVVYFVDRILKGARPADLPIEQPTKYELVINLGTARALGVTLPQSVVLRADHVIQ